MIHDPRICYPIEPSQERLSRILIGRQTLDGFEKDLSGQILGHMLIPHPPEHIAVHGIHVAAV
jgi:hypothetical protein